MKIYQQVLILTVMVFTVLSCSSNQHESHLLIFAAASMTDVLQEITDEYENQNSAVEIHFNYGGSQSLAAQLNQGAPGDIFISAGFGPVGFLLESEKIMLTGLAEIALNRLVVVTHPDLGTMMSMEQLLEMDRIAIADPDLAPAGWYARESLQNIGLWDSLLRKIVFGPDVRATLNYVRTGNADAGIVYYTDALSTPELNINELIPADSHENIAYPVVVPVKGEKMAEAMKLAKFLKGDFSRRTLQKYGFMVPKE